MVWPLGGPVMCFVGSCHSPGIHYAGPEVGGRGAWTCGRVLGGCERPALIPSELPARAGAPVMLLPRGRHLYGGGAVMHLVGSREPPHVPRAVLTGAPAQWHPQCLSNVRGLRVWGPASPFLSTSCYVTCSCFFRVNSGMAHCMRGAGVPVGSTSRGRGRALSMGGLPPFRWRLWGRRGGTAAHAVH